MQLPTLIYQPIITHSSIPDKFIRDWKLLFVKGVSLSEEDALTNSSTSSEGSFHDQQDCDDLLDDEDFKEYLVSKMKKYVHVLCTCICTYTHVYYVNIHVQ